MAALRRQQCFLSRAREYFPGFMGPPPCHSYSTLYRDSIKPQCGIPATTGWCLPPTVRPLLTSSPPEPHSPSCSGEGRDAPSPLLPRPYLRQG